MSAIEKATRARRIQGEKGPQIAASEPIKRSELELKLIALLATAEGLVDRSLALRERLAPISYPFEADAVDFAAQDSHSVQIIERLHHVMDRLARADEVLGNTMDRLAV